MPANTLVTSSVVKVAENVLDQIFNFNPSDSPLISMIERTSIDNVYFEWQRDAFRAPDPARAAIEGADASYSTQAQPGLLNNRTQIFQDTVSVSNTAERIKKYGRTKEAKRLVVKKMVELKRDIEAAALSGAVTVAGTSSVAGRMRGLYGFITSRKVGSKGVAPDPTTNTAPVNGDDVSVVEGDFKVGLQTVYQNGGDGAVVLCSPAHKVKISTFTGNVTRSNDVGTKAGAVINAAFDFYRSDFGVTKIVPNRIQSTAVAGLNDTIYILDPDKLALAQLRPFESEELATVGDASNWQVRAEVSLLVRDEKPLYAITDILPAG